DSDGDDGLLFVARKRDPAEARDHVAAHDGLSLVAVDAIEREIDQAADDDAEDGERGERTGDTKVAEGLLHEVEKQKWHDAEAAEGEDEAEAAELGCVGIEEVLAGGHGGERLEFGFSILDFG